KYIIVFVFFFFFFPGQIIGYRREENFANFANVQLLTTSLIQFHENGRKHKENVSKKLTEMQKKASKEARNAVNFENEMKKIEAAALKAYANDVKLNADYTSHLIKSGEKILPTPEIDTKPNNNKNLLEFKKRKEGISEDSNRNDYAGESTSRTTSTGLEKSMSNFSSKKKSKILWKKQKKPNKTNVFSDGEKQTQPNIDPREETNFVSFPQGHPYGKWKTVETIEKKPVDLQLPVQEFISISVPKLSQDIEKKFKEKVIEPDTNSCKKEKATFIKRKISADVKNNIRKKIKIDDDN
ncbi:conserved hypothetical protein, partial [Pediculus humanus corporis]